jgi:curved DNA-binding protein CbpA
MSIDDNNYALLGVSPNATPKELRQAYLQLLVTAHPDKGGSAEGFDAIQKAYAILADPAERVIYDEQLKRKNNNRTSSSHAAASHTSSVTTNNNGVTAYVHGQTNFPPERPENHRLAGGAIFAGQPIASTMETTASLSTSLASITERIRLLKKNGNGVSGFATKASAASEQRQEKEKTLAELYTQRAALHFEAGRAHHATFDVQEALRIYPECIQAAVLLEKLKEGSILENKNLTANDGEE